MMRNELVWHTRCRFRLPDLGLSGPPTPTLRRIGEQLELAFDHILPSLQIGATCVLHHLLQILGPLEGESVTTHSFYLSFSTNRPTGKGRGRLLPEHLQPPAKSHPR